MKNKESSFRLFLTLILLGALVVQAKSVFAQSSKYHEDPLLTQMVSQGLLPPVDQRLPENPKVVKPLHEVGHYGGTANIYSLGYTFEVMQLMGVSTPFIQDPNGQPGLPHIFTGYEVNNDFTVYTFHLRKGVRWSDGVVLT